MKYIYFLIIIPFLILLMSIMICLYFNLSDKFTDSKISNNKTVEEFLEQYRHKKIILIPFDGNSGDAIILLGTFNMLKKLNINYEIGNINNNYQNEIIIINGGGNLVGMYNDVNKIITKFEKNNKVILLPHTIKDEDKLLSNLDKNTIIFCRELKSYNYTKNKAKFKENIFIDNDMAFRITNLKKYIKPPSNIFPFFQYESPKVANCYRIDNEKTNINIPDDNNDISITINDPNQINNEIMNQKICDKFLTYLSKFDIINTNRLHVAIASSLLGKRVNFYGNSYWKNKEVYNFSIKNNFNKTIFYN